MIKSDITPPRASKLMKAAVNDDNEKESAIELDETVPSTSDIQQLTNRPAQENEPSQEREGAYQTNQFIYMYKKVPERHLKAALILHNKQYYLPTGYALLQDQQIKNPIFYTRLQYPAMNDMIVNELLFKCITEENKTIYWQKTKDNQIIYWIREPDDTESFGWFTQTLTKISIAPSPYPSRRSISTHIEKFINMISEKGTSTYKGINNLDRVSKYVLLTLLGDSANAERTSEDYVHDFNNDTYAFGETTYLSVADIAQMTEYGIQKVANSLKQLKKYGFINVCEGNKSISVRLKDIKLYLDTKMTLTNTNHYIKPYNSIK